MFLTRLKQATFLGLVALLATFGGGLAAVQTAAEQHQRDPARQGRVLSLARTVEPNRAQPEALTPILPSPGRRKREEREAVAAILKLGGAVMYEYQRPNPAKPNVFDPEARPRDPKAFHRVVSVSLRDTRVTDDDLKLLQKLTAVENLDLTNTRVTGSGLAHLRGLKNLAVLSLWKTRVDDVGLAHLEGLTRLWQLVLDDTTVTDAGLAHLAGLTNLEEWLGLAGTKITDAGLKHLTKLTRLQSLNVRLTAVTENGARTLKKALPDTQISVETVPLPPAARKGRQPEPEEYVRPLTVVEVRGYLSYQPEAKGSNPPDGSVRVGSQFDLQVFWLDWSQAPELREQAKKLHMKRVELLGTLKSPGRGYVAIGYSGTLTVKALREVKTRPQK
jgi:hypothetical protein